METLEDDILDEIVIPENNNGIIAVKGDYYLTRKLNLDNMLSNKRMCVAKEVCAFIVSSDVTTLILNFIYRNYTLYRTQTRIDMICKIFKLLINCTPFIIDINDNIFYPDDTLQKMINMLQDKGFTVKYGRIFLHHSLHNKK